MEKSGHQKNLGSILAYMNTKSVNKMARTFMPLMTYFSVTNKTFPLLIDQNYFYIFGYQLDKIMVQNVMPFKEVYLGLPEDSNDPHYMTKSRIMEPNQLLLKIKGINADIDLEKCFLKFFYIFSI